MSIHLDCTLQPVTALEFCSSSGLLLLVGEGPYLKAFDLKSRKLLCQYKVFDDQIIHGIAVREDVSCTGGLNVVIWGGRCLYFLSFGNLESFLHLSNSDIAENVILMPDWIFDVAISLDEPKTCAAVTAHNTLLLVTNNRHFNQDHIQCLSTPLQCILYSAHVIWEKPELLLVAAGTVFGDVVVWQCGVGNKTSSDAQLLFVFKGHEGSVFGVNISPSIVNHDGVASRLVASCSDDRTIRVWDISKSADLEGQHCAKAPDTSFTHAETGFKNTYEPEFVLKSHARCIGVMMAHASRIWRVKFLLDSSTGFDPPCVFVFSFGEDSTVQQWQLQFEEPQLSAVSDGVGRVASRFSASLSLSQTFAFHSGKSLWSAALYQVTKARTLMVTGGADGKISMTRIINETPNKKKPPSTILSIECGIPEQAIDELADDSWREQIWDIHHVLGSLRNPIAPSAYKSGCTNDTSQRGVIENSQPPVGPSKISVKGKRAPADGFNRYAFLSETHLLLTTTFGRVLLGRLVRPITWQEVFMPAFARDDLKSYTVLKGFADLGVAFIASASGRVFIYQLDQVITEVGVVESKVADLFGIDDRSTSSFNLLVTTLLAKNVNLFHFGVNSSGEFTFINSFTFQVPQSFVVTSACGIRTVVILGSRAGALALYDTQYSLQCIALWRCPDTVNGDAVTSFTLLKNVKSAPHNGKVITTSRDGFCAIFTWEITAGPGAPKAAICQIHRVRPPLGPMIEHGWFSESDFCLYGFRGKEFVVWNERQQLEIATVRCGGGHRSYAYCAPRIGDIGYFVYTKASKLYLRSHRGASHAIVRSGGHGREIKACAVSKDGRLIATGAEDTTVRIWRYLQGNSGSGHHQFECLAVLNSHVTGIQRLRWYESTYLFSSGGNGEFIVWAVEDVPGFGVGVLQEAISPTQNDDRDLRVMDFDVTKYATPANPASTSPLLISLAYSDSTIKTYGYAKELGFILLASGRYTTSSLMQIAHIEATETEITYLTTATDGKVVIWRSPIFKSWELAPTSLCVEEPVIVLFRKLHQSSIKSSDWTFFGSRRYMLVATGGDDNALGMLLLQVDGKATLGNVLSCSILKSAHAAAITGLCIASEKLNPDGVYEFRIVSSSNDQRVKEWKVLVETARSHDMHECHVAIRKLGDVFTAVADVGDVAVIPGNGIDSGAKMLVVGAGMEMLNLSCEDL